MKTPAVKGLFAAAAAVLFAATPLVGRSVTINVTKFQQRYPWNGLVDIDYTISRSGGESELDPAKHSVRISVVNYENAVTNVAHAFRQGALPVSDGAHRVTWDANAEGVNFKSQDVEIFAEIVYYAEKYMVIDVSGGPNTNFYPVTYLHGAPEGGFTNDTYRTSKIALRLVPPGSFVMGSPTTESGRTPASEVQHAVAITKPFYIGVFQITQKQYYYVMGGTIPAAGNDYRPRDTVSYHTIRGTAIPQTHQYDWPHTQEVDMQNSFMGKLRSKCREQNSSGAWEPVSGLFDLPTDAQWEYACRAGTTSAYNNGGNNVSDLEKLGYYGQKVGGTAAVGNYAPNAWGIYDMHGNLWEWCRDWFQADVQNTEHASVDPAGAASGSKRVGRGGSWAHDAASCRSAWRVDVVPTAADVCNGFRLSMSLP